jgi:hypothetical protein
VPCPRMAQLNYYCKLIKLQYTRVTTGAPDSPVTYDVVTLKTLLEKAGITFHKLSGKRPASCLLVEAADGYRVVIALPEIDPAFTKSRFCSLSCEMGNRA